MPAWTVWLVGWQGCTCRPDLSDPSNPSDTSSSTTSDTTADTGPAPLCAAPEAEPNGSTDEANALPLEVWACGSFGAENDGDYWSFSHVEDGWLKVEVDAANGSVADPMVFLTPAEGGWAVQREDDLGASDLTLVFLAPAGDYSVFVAEQGGAGGDRFGYDLLVSEAKPPVEWTAIETEPNDTALEAIPIAVGAEIYGTLEKEGPLPDFDYYVIAVPAGPHVLGIDVDAFEASSSADVDIVIRNQSLEQVRQISGGGTDQTPKDPLGDYLSDGAEVLYIQVVNGDAYQSESPAHWYVLRVSLEEGS